MEQLSAPATAFLMEERASYQTRINCLEKARRYFGKALVIGVGGEFFVVENASFGQAADDVVVGLFEVDHAGDVLVWHHFAP